MEHFSRLHFEGSESSAVAKLDRKRASDRRAQQAARQRRQEYIETLQYQLETLSGLPFDQVQEFFQTNERLRVENTQLRNRAAPVPQTRCDKIGAASSSPITPPCLSNTDKRRSASDYESFELTSREPSTQDELSNTKKRRYNNWKI